MLTRALKEVEAILGLELFQRGARGVTANAFGQAFVADARAILASVRQAGERLIQMANAEIGTVTVGNHLAGSTVLLPKAIARLKAQSPGVTVVVREATPDTLRTELLAGEVGLVVGRLGRESEDGRFEQRPLYREPVRPVARAGHPAQRLAGVTLQDLAAYPWILPVAQTGLRHEIEGVFRRAQVPLPANRIECTSLPVVRGLLVETDMVSPLPLLLGSLDDGLGVLPVDLEPVGQTVGITLAAHRDCTPATRLLVEYLEAVAIEMLPSLRG